MHVDDASEGFLERNEPLMLAEHLLGARQVPRGVCRRQGCKMDAGSGSETCFLWLRWINFFKNHELVASL